jgi:hypothetical protein
MLVIEGSLSEEVFFQADTGSAGEALRRYGWPRVPWHSLEQDRPQAAYLGDGGGSLQRFCTCMSLSTSVSHSEDSKLEPGWNTARPHKADTQITRYTTLTAVIIGYMWSSWT